MIDSRFYTHNGPFSLTDLLAPLGLELGGAAASKDITISDAAPLTRSTKGDLSYYGGRANKDDLVGAVAAACLTLEKDADAVRDAGIIPIISKFPRADFASIIERLYTRISFTAGAPLIDPSAKVSSTAQIMPGAVIGKNAQIDDHVIIGPNAVIGPGVIIGENSRVDSNANIVCAIIGKNCKIHSSACIGGDGFGVAPSATGAMDIPHVGRTLIADNVSIGYGTMVDRGMLGDTIIGKGTKIDNLSQIAHNTVIGENCMIAGHAGISGSVTVKDNVLMGGRVGIADHLTIGRGARLAASTALMHDVPDGETWSGYPAKPIRQHMRETAILKRMATKPKKDRS